MSQELIEVKVSEITGGALDWAVAKAEIAPLEMPASDALWGKYCTPYSPSTDWSQGGPLIDKYRVELNWDGETQCRETGYWGYAHGAVSWSSEGDTALIAACRAIVASVLGPVVSVPKELVHE